MLLNARFVPVALATFLIAAPTLAGAPPVSFSKTVQSLDAVERVVMPPMDNATLLETTLAREAGVRGGTPYIFASAIRPRLTLDNGTWEVLADGSWLWRIVISSPGATSLSMMFDPFALPEDAKMWVYGMPREHILGPYSNAERSHHGRLWIPPLDAESVVVELHAASGPSTVSLSIEQVHHGFRPFPTKGGQGPCNIDVVCPEGNPWRDEIRSVARYVADGVGGCTGQLVNNTANDGRLLFLTAQHCNVRSINDDSVILFWDDESPVCGQQSGGIPIAHQGGTTFRAGHESSDFSLLELNSPPPLGANVYFSGWDATGSTPSSTFAIHHPSGGEKSLAFDAQQPVTQTNILFQGGLVVSETWQTIWGAGNGTTEGGSSGSCLRNENTGRCVGTLSGGSAACSAPNDPDYFAKLSRSWSGGGTTSTRLRDWLDPGNTGAMTLGGIDPGVTTSCVPSPTIACLVGGRFQVQVDWQAANGSGGAAQVFQGLNSDLSTLLHFGNAENLEFLVKMLDACNTPFNSFWLFAAATTNVEYTLTVTDTETNAVRTYFNPLGNPAPAITDTEAFMTCP